MDCPHTRFSAEYRASLEETVIPVCNLTANTINDGSTNFNLLVIDAQQVERLSEALEATGLREQRPTLPPRDTARAMSQENLEVVRRQFEAWSAGDLDKWLVDWDPDVVVVAPEGWPEGAVNRGLDAWRRQAERLRDSWTDARIEIDEIRPVEDRVLARIRYVTKGADSGLPFETQMAAVFFFEGRKIKRAEYYWGTDEALEAAGLREQAMSQENVELVLKGAEDWNRGDLDAWFDLFADDVVLRAAEGWPERPRSGRC